MLCNLLPIQALLLTICPYLFTAPEHLLGQSGKREQSVYRRAAQGRSRRNGNGRMLVGAQWLSGRAGREQS